MLFACYRSIVLIAMRKRFTVREMCVCVDFCHWLFHTLQFQTSISHVIELYELDTRFQVE